ncbi:protein-L-isoaspartate (D-aspartate) O-methyltransferase domain containing 2, isoform CRA_a [Mus musculus]|nr:protein-L-isoaspartate (D-aspartate) O-methyltransferase domain containing 2, isoform CRA_a [Mus musculus]
MGGAVSAGEDNDELIDNLKEAQTVQTCPATTTSRAQPTGPGPACYPWQHQEGYATGSHKRRWPEEHTYV